MDFLKNYLKNEATLKKLLDEYKDCFETINHYGEILKDKSLTSPGAMKDAILELVGVYVSLNSVSANLESELRYRENHLTETKRYDKKLKTDETSYVKKIEFIGYLRRMKNLFSERCDSASKIISVLQSILRGIEQEKLMPYD